ncbi:MAG: hypothetical protein LBJ46_05770 [Planctomycetota bacterium]|jgi:hypothetical protein|nr:hypothetical protein [Planctomycetota bacterium]
MIDDFPVVTPMKYMVRSLRGEYSFGMGCSWAMKTGKDKYSDNVTPLVRYGKDAIFLPYGDGRERRRPASEETRYTPVDSVQNPPWRIESVSSGIV